MKHDTGCTPGRAFASGLLAGLGAALVVTVLGAALRHLETRWGGLPTGAPELGALVAAPAAAWVTTLRRGCALSVRLRASLLALLIGFFFYWLFSYLLMLSAFVSLLSGNGASDQAPGALDALLWTMFRGALAASFLNALLGAALGLMFGRRVGAWADLR